jgi:epoxide hydrolase 4
MIPWPSHVYVVTHGPTNGLGAESALLVGHDWGGSIAWTIAMNHPEVVDRLAILNAPIRGGCNRDCATRASSGSPGTSSSSSSSRYRGCPRTWGMPETGTSSDTSWRRRTRLTRRRNRTLRRGVVAARGSGRDDQLLPRLGQTAQKEAAAKLRPISAPTLVIWGERDSYLGSNLAEPARDDVPNLDRVERLAAASHWVLARCRSPSAHSRRSTTCPPG